MPFTYTIDPDHEKKRLIAALSVKGGYFWDNNVHFDLWKRLSNERPNVIPNTFWKRDTQNVPLANLFISEKVEEAFINP